MTQALKIVARIAASPGAADALEAEMKLLVEQTCKEAGCRHYDLYRGTEKPDVFVFVEEWDTTELWQTHMAGAAIKAFNARIGSGMIESGEILQLRPVI